MYESQFELLWTNMPSRKRLTLAEKAKIIEFESSFLSKKMEETTKQLKITNFFEKNQ